MPATLRVLALLPLVALAPLLAAGPIRPTVAEPPPRGYVCVKAPKAPTIDGKLDDAAWQAAPWSEDFADIEGGDKPRPRYRTRMKMTWDDAALYVAAELEEPHVWATIDEHDAVIFQDPDFEVFLDPDGDGHNYAELELNAKNTTWDLLLTKPYKDGGKALNGWEAIKLRTAVRVDGTLNDPRDRDRGWTIEIAWPWEGLKELSDAPVPPRAGDQWRANFSRVEWDMTTEDGRAVKVKGKPENNWIWSPQGVVDMHRPERWGYVQFAPATGAEYKPDPAWATQARLYEVYYAQRAYREKHGHYAKSADELGLPTAGGKAAVTATPRGYEATLTGPGGKLWGVGDDGRLWGR